MTKTRKPNAHVRSVGGTAAANAFDTRPHSTTGYVLAQMSTFAWQNLRRIDYDAYCQQRRNFLLAQAAQYMKKQA